MARCPDCNKFVPNGELEAELQSEDITDNELYYEVRLMIPCGECGTELKEYNAEGSIEIDHDCPAFAEGYDFEITDSDASPYERVQDKDARGKPINPRYQKRYYGANLTFKVTCNKCKEEFTVEDAVEEQASYFEPCY